MDVHGCNCDAWCLAHGMGTPGNLPSFFLFPFLFVSFLFFPVRGRVCRARPIVQFGVRAAVPGLADMVMGAWLLRWLSPWEPLSSFTTAGNQRAAEPPLAPASQPSKFLSPASRGTKLHTSCNAQLAHAHQLHTSTESGVQQDKKKFLTRPVV